MANRTLHAQARAQAQCFPGARISQKTPWDCDLVLVKPRREKACGRGRRPRHYRKAERANREPWLLATSVIDLAASRVVAMYAKRMQIEESFRDLKCDRYGCALHYSLTRRRPRLAILLLLHALATFVAWLTALCPETDTPARDGGIGSRRTRRHYSLLRLGWERLRRRETTICWRDLWHAFRHPPRWWLASLEIPK